MAALRRALSVLALAGCQHLDGFGGPTPPLATFTVEVDGDPATVRPAGETGPQHLQVALVWGKQWLTEALCILPPESSAAAAAIAAGCRDPFGFVPARVEANVPIELGVPATIDLSTVPADDVLVGDVTARVAYGTLVVYDDRNQSGTLELARPNRIGNPNPDGPPMMDPTPTRLPDDVYGASFLTMTAPDVRVAYREGDFDAAAAFYPRAGCDPPPVAFSVIGAGGFTADAAIAATLAGQLPQEPAGSCTEAAPADATIAIAVQPPSAVAEVACNEPSADSSVRYREPPAQAPDFTDRTTACVHLPTFGGPPSTTVELIVSGRTEDTCKGLTHYVLRGCPGDPNCAMPEWDHTAVPPSWWPCPAS
jgi:hypothetical protein